MEDRLLTHQAAQILNRTPETVRELARAGKLRAIRIGHIRLFDRQEIELFRERRDRKLAETVKAGR